MKFKKGLGLWASILLLALFLRLAGLDLNPVGLSHDDELHDLMNAKSIALTGENVPGVVAGILTPNGHCLNGDCIYGELETYAQIPWMWFFPLDILLSKIPFILASVGLVWATGKLFENLSKNPAIGKITGLLLAINPWAIYYGRTAYSYTFCFLLFILAAYFFTREKSFKSNLIFGGLSAFGASLFYFGAKPIFPFVILWGIIYNLYQFKFGYLKFTLCFGLVTTFIIGGYFFILFNSLAGKRFLEIGAADISIVDRISAYLGFFSPVQLFLTGQRATDNYFLSGHGYFYLIELPFLILGMIALLVRKDKSRLLLILIAIAVLPVAIKTSPASIYSLRAGLAYPLMIGIIAWGYYYVFSKMQIEQRRISISGIFLAAVGFSYLISIAYFSFLYWHSLPVEQAARWFFHERVMTNYITRIRKHSDQNIFVLSGRPDGIFNSYVFFSGNYESKAAVKEINDNYLTGNFGYKGVKFINDCNQLINQDLQDSLIFVDQANQVNCGLNKKNISKIANPKDAGGMFDILNDSLCQKYPQHRFPTPKNIFDFKVEGLNDEDFCRIWITNPDNFTSTL